MQYDLQHELAEDSLYWGFLNLQISFSVLFADCDNKDAVTLKLSFRPMVRELPMFRG